MDIFTMIAQSIGIAAMILTILSMQFRSNKNFFLCQEAGGLLFATSFFMIGAWGGAVMNVFGMIRPELLRHEKIAKSKYALLFLILLLAVCTLVVFLVSDEKWYFILMVAVAQLAGTVSMWFRDGKKIRLCQLFIISPLWLAYDALIPTPSIGGIFTEIINICSVCLALYRYRKIGFTER